MHQTLSELKAENAKLEAAETEESPQDEEVEVVEDEAAEVVEEESEDVAEEDETETETEVEAWQQSEDEDSQESDTEGDDSAIWATARKKYKAKSEKEKTAHSEEIEQLKAQMEALKTQNNTASVPTGKPKRDNYFDHDDPDEAYLDAMFEWRNAQQAGNQQQATQQASNQKAVAALNDSVDQHYARAAKLAKANKIEPEVYQKADGTVRNAIGEDITNAIISNLGEGSEKVMFNLGRNPKKLAELQGLLASDPQGFKVMAMLGRMTAELTPQKRKTNAPAPAKTVQSGSKTANTEKRMKTAYEKAFKSGDTSKAFTMKREAKKAGHNTRDW